MSRNLTKFQRLPTIQRKCVEDELQQLADRYLEAERYLPESQRVSRGFIALLALIREPPKNGQRRGVTSNGKKTRADKRRGHWL